LDAGDLLYALILTVTVWAAVALVAITHAPHELGFALRRGRVIGPVVLISCVGMPLLAWGLSQSLGVPVLETTGILIVAAASAGPLSLKVVDVAGGDLPLAVGLILILELANVVFIPLWPALLLPQGVSSPALDVGRSVLILILLPLLAGWGMRQRCPDIAERSATLLRRISTTGFVIALMLVLARNVGDVADVLDSGVVVVAAVTLIAGMLAAALLTGPDRPTRVTASLVTGVRANAAALAVAGTAFAGQPRLTAAIVVFGLLSICLPSIAAAGLARGRGTRVRGATTPGSGELSGTEGMPT
jgi:bile acid:Na+ symporter, BASS family